MKTKHLWAGLSALCVSAVCWAQPHADKHYTISGETSAIARAGTAVLLRRGTAPSSAEELARVPIESGKFSFEGEVDWVDEARVVVVGPGKDEPTLGEVRIILEPGTTRITLDRARVAISGGTYYQRAIESWERSPRYRAAMKKADQILGKLQQAPPGEQKPLSEEARRAVAEATRARNELLDQVVASHPDDPLLRYLAEENKQADFAARLATFTALQRELPGHVGLSRLIAETRDSQARTGTAGAIREGTKVRDFYAPDATGREVRLSEILGRQKYVLVDFWASWCAFCRAEFPYLKRAYDRFHAGGFEIVSVSVDESGPAWRKATAAEKIPWVNLCDLQALRGPIPTMFGVLGLPTNYLVDAHGKVVARDLRGEELQKKLAELLREKA